MDLDTIFKILFYLITLKILKTKRSWANITKGQKNCWADKKSKSLQMPVSRLQFFSMDS